MAYIPGIIVVVLIIFFIYNFNSLTMKRNMVDNAFAMIDTQLKLRFDLIPNITAATSEYMKHESETLTEIAKMRSSASGVAEKSSLDSKMTAGLRNLMVQIEAYPELKASENIKNLQASLNEVEAQLAAARRSYNSAVTAFNSSIEMFPGCMFAPMMHLTKRELFEIPPEERKNVDVDQLFKR